MIIATVILKQKADMSFWSEEAILPRYYLASV